MNGGGLSDSGKSDFGEALGEDKIEMGDETIEPKACG